MALRILALTNLYPTPWQPGRAPFNRQLFRALAEAFPLHVIAPIAWTDELRARGRNNASFGARHAMRDGITVEYPRFLFPPKLMRDWYGHFMVRSIRGAFARAIEEFRPNVVYGSWAYPDGWAAIQLGHRAELPVVVRVHGSDIHLLERYPARRRRTQETLAAADRIVAPSRELARRCIELGADPETVRVIYNGVDTELFRPGSQPEARRRLNLPIEGSILLFAGNLVPLKGLDVLMDSCARLAATTMDFSCHLIGQGPMIGRLQRRIHDLGLGRRVTLHGSKPLDQMPDWYRAADVLVLPSHSEGTPNVLLEAIASGTRFVASSVGGIPEIAPLGRGRLTPPGDAGSLATAIHETLLEARSDAPPAPLASRSFNDAAVELAALFEEVAGLRDEHHQTPVGRSQVAGGIAR